MDHLENDESENVIQYDDSYFHPSKSLLVTAFCNPLAIPPCNDEHFDFCVDDDNYPEENIQVFFSEIHSKWLFSDLNSYSLSVKSGICIANLKKQFYIIVPVTFSSFIVRQIIS